MTLLRRHLFQLVGAAIALAAVSHVASAQTAPLSHCASSCRVRPALRPISSRASSRKGCRRPQGSRLMSKISRPALAQSTWTRPTSCSRTAIQSSSTSAIAATRAGDRKRPCP